MVVAKAITNCSFFITNDFILTGDVHHLELNVVEFNPYFKTTTTMRNMNTKLTFILPFMESYANSVLDKGFKLPLPQNLTRFILREKVIPKNGYLLIDADADFTQIVEPTPSSSTNEPTLSPNFQVGRML